MPGVDLPVKRAGNSRPDGVMQMPYIALHSDFRRGPSC